MEPGVHHKHEWVIDDRTTLKRTGLIILVVASTIYVAKQHPSKVFMPLMGLYELNSW